MLDRIDRKRVYYFSDVIINGCFRFLNLISTIHDSKGNAQFK